MRGLAGKTVLIAGGTGGVGTATARRLAAEGCEVVVGARNETVVQAVVAEIQDEGGRAHGVHLDITDDDSVASAVRSAVDVFGGLDAVHINAAAMAPDVIGRDTDAATIDIDVFDRTIDVNLRGALSCTRHAVPALLDRGGGAVVYTSSTAAFIGEPERVAYAMTKSGMHALVRHVASRWGNDGIRANAIAAGPVFSDTVLDHLGPERVAAVVATLRSPRIGRPDDVAAVVALLVSDDGEWVNGQVIGVDGGMVLR